MHSLTFRAWVSIALAGFAHAHQAIYHQAMYCLNGTDPSHPDLNNALPTRPLFEKSYSDFWMHHFDKCDEFPPDKGVFMELPAGGSITLEIATNRAFSSLNSDAVLTDWPNGETYPDDYNEPDCITQPNLHTQNQSMAAGTALAISYHSSVQDVNPDNLIVFSVRYNTPFKRLVTYDIPSGMPSCPEDGCICTFLWIPNGCGQSNIYMFPYQCTIIPDSTAPKQIGSPKPAVWCEDDQSACVQGPKQMLIWHQAESNNIEVSGDDLSGQPKSPGYNSKCGFKDGAQTDIFVDSNTADDATNTSSLPAGSGVPTGSMPLPTASSAHSSVSPLPSGTANSTSGTCTSQTTAIPHSKRMKMRWEKRHMF